MKCKRCHQFLKGKWGACGCNPADYTLGELGDRLKYWRAFCKRVDRNNRRTARRAGRL